MRSPFWSGLLTTAVVVVGLGICTLFSRHPSSVLVGTVAIVLGVPLAVVAVIRLRAPRGASQ